MMFERKDEPLLSRVKFAGRILRSVLLAAGLVAGSLGIGVVGYHVFSGLPWIDSLLNASMILTGMGPVDPMKTAGAKLFASFYALFSGVAFLTLSAILFAPVIHRFLHRFHLELAEDDGGDDDGGGKATPGRASKPRRARKSGT